jgi:hypothetical protein
MIPERLVVDADAADKNCNKSMNLNSFCHATPFSAEYTRLPLHNDDISALFRDDLEQLVPTKMTEHEWLPYNDASF